MDRIHTGIKEEDLQGFCEQMKAQGARRCDPTSHTDGTFDVLVVFPDFGAQDEGDDFGFAQSAPHGSGDGPD